MARKTTTAPARARRELIEIDPALLDVDDQVRADATPDEGMIESVSTLGIIQPPTVYLDEDRGQYVIITGHRRVGAAIIAGLPTIEVIVGSKDDVADARRAQRQLAENERRKQLTPLDVARGYAEQQLFGLTPAEIAHQVGEKPDRVKAALKAVKSDKGREALDGGVDLAQAAVIADLASDDENAATQLLRIAQDSPAEFARHAALAESNRKIRARRAELEQQVAAEGLEIAATLSYSAQYWSSNGENGAQRSLAVLEIQPADHVDCPGHAATIENCYDIDDMAIAYICTQARLHETDAQKADREQLDTWNAQRAEREAQRAKEKADREANTTARREWIRGFLTGRLNQTPGIFDLIADMHIGVVVLDDWATSEVPTAIELLTGTRPKGNDEYELAQMIERGEVTALRALTAHAFAVAEYFADDPGMLAPRTLIAYYRRLQIWGYPLTELDTTSLDEARTALAEDEADGKDAIASGGTDDEQGAA